MKNSEAWLKCEITDGMFPGEFTIQAETFDDLAFSFFTSGSVVDLKNHSVQVDLLQSTDDYCIVCLPSTPLENIGQIVKVPKESIKETIAA